MPITLLENGSYGAERRDTKNDARVAATLTVTKEVTQRKVLVVGIPEFGHLMPMLHIAAGMAKREHRVQLVTCSFLEKQMRTKCADCGVEFVGLCPEIQAPEAGVGRNGDLKKDGRYFSLYLYYNDSMLAELRELIQTTQPDVILTDFMTQCAVEAASGSSAEVIVNFPGPLAIISNFSASLAPYMVPPLAPVLLGLPAAEIPATYSMIRRIQSMLFKLPWLLNTFWGLEKPTALPPNLILTGPPAPRQTGPVVETSMQALNAWLEGVKQEELKVVYVSMGTMVALKRWQVEGLYNGLAALGCAVVWSLKEDQQAFLPEVPPKRFFVNKWLPQAEALQLPEVVAVVTHCGWGGFMEAVAAGKPIVATPFLGDQPDNARLAVERGLAELLLPKNFKASYVQAAVGKILGNQKYAIAAEQARRALLATGGVTRCCEVIEDVANHGSKALV